VGVSNSLDTLEKYSLKVHHSIEEVHSVVFTPYTHEAISALILEKLEQLRERGLQVELKMVNYVAKKLETVTKGDLRIFFEFVKELICEVLSQDTPSPSQPHCPITIDAVERVFRKMENSKADLIMSLPFSQKLLLMGTCAII
jgi:Cdc6-like AAA superfamily ATPase